VYLPGATVVGVGEQEIFVGPARLDGMQPEEAVAGRPRNLEGMTWPSIPCTSSPAQAKDARSCLPRPTSSPTTAMTTQVIGTEEASAVHRSGSPSPPHRRGVARPRLSPRGSCCSMALESPRGGWSRWWECLESSDSGDSGDQWIEKKRRRQSAYVVFFVLVQVSHAARKSKPPKTVGVRSARPHSAGS
jgi:hypothetical protein